MRNIRVLGRPAGAKALGGDADVAALAIFKSVEGELRASLQACSSGRELAERGYPEDVDLAAELNVSRAVPLLEAKAFRNVLS